MINTTKYREHTMENKKNTLSSFKTIGLLGVSLAIGIGATSIISSGIDKADMEKAQYNAQQVKICQTYVQNALDDINKKSIVDPSYLNTAEGMQISGREKIKKAQLSELSPEKVNCNIQDMRAKFIEDVNKINQQNNKRRNLGVTLG